MKCCSLALLSFLAAIAPSAHAQTALLEVNDGVDNRCYTSAGGAACATPPQAEPSVTSTVLNDSGTGWSEFNVIPAATAMYTYDADAGYAGAGTQLNGPTGQFVATGRNADEDQDSSILLQSDVGFIRTRDTTVGTFGFLETHSTGTTLGYADVETGTMISGITTSAAGHQVVGNTSVQGTLSASGTSTLSGVDNQNAGIASAGLISGVSAGAVSATSTQAINGSQLHATNTNVINAQATADTALGNASIAQQTAEGAASMAVAAQGTADSALASAGAAQGTADVALVHAARAQGTADAAATDAAASQAMAGQARTEAASAHVAANEAMGTSATAMTTANAASSLANAAYGMASGMDGRVTALETAVSGFSDEVRRVDRMAGRGIAIATALASVPDIEPGKRMGLGFGVGSYAGNEAVSAAFVVRASDALKLRINAGTSGDGRFAIGAGGMFSW